MQPLRGVRHAVTRVLMSERLPMCRGALCPRRQPVDRMLLNGRLHHHKPSVREHVLETEVLLLLRTYGERERVRMGA